MLVKVLIALGSIVNLKYGFIYNDRKYDGILQKYLDIDMTSIRIKRSKELFIFGILGLFIPNQFYWIWLIVLIVVGSRSEIKFRNLYKNMENQLNYDFPIWIRFVQSNLQNNTVYQSLLLSKEYASILLKPNLEILIERIERNPNEISYYEGFMEEFSNYEIKKMMIHLYRYNYVGVSESIMQLQSQIQASNTWIEKTRVSLFERQREWYKWLSSVPMLAVTFLFIIMMFQVMVTVMEGGWSV